MKVAETQNPGSFPGRDWRDGVLRCHRENLVCVLICLVAAACTTPPEGTPLYEAREPFETGMLQVSEIHRIYFELYGTRVAPPVIVLHGGPGYGSYRRLTQYFDPLDFFIILHDQRGSGRSQPLGELRQNTTQDLVGDVERLRRHLGLEEIVLFGTGWGSTLALAYAETYPDNVDGLLLHAPFTATRQETVRRFELAQIFFPRKFENLVHAFPKGRTPGGLKDVADVVLGDDDEKASSVLRAYNRLIYNMIGMDVNDLTVTEALNRSSFEEQRDFAKIALHYARNDYFLEDDQLIRDARIVSEIQTVIVNSRYDLLFPLETAHRLHRQLRNSELRIVEKAGHSQSEQPVIEALIQAVEVFDRYSG